MVKEGFYLLRDKKSTASTKMVLLRQPFRFQRGGTLARSGTWTEKTFKWNTLFSKFSVFPLFGTTSKGCPKFSEMFPGN